MPSRLAARILPIIVFAMWLTWSCLAIGSVPDSQEEALYAALLEPSLADDGRISEAEHQAILRTARRLLNDRQMAELERRIAEHTSQPASDLRPSSPVGHVPEPASAEAAVPVFLPDNVPHSSQFGSLLDGLSVGVGYNGSKDPQTLGIDAHNGGRAEVNWAYPVLRDWGVSVQAGFAANYERSAVKVLEVLNGTVEREQYYTTVGIFQQTGWGLRLGIVHDWLAQDYFSRTSLTQWRGQIGYALDDDNEIGFWGATGDKGANTALAGVPFEFIALQQGSVYWRHFWWQNIETKLWVGLVPRHSKTVFILPEVGPAHNQISYGSEIFVPLSERVAIWGEANFINPVSSGTVDAALGLAFYFGGTTREVRRADFGPMFRVANNATFSVDAKP